jgi:hypothetical protein
VKKVIDDTIQTISLIIVALAVLIVYGILLLLWTAHTQCENGGENPMLIYENVIIGYSCPVPTTEEAAYILPFEYDEDLPEDEEFHL